MSSGRYSSLRLPTALADIEALPGIGRSTAAAIAGFAFGARAAILDGNVKRVLTRHFGVDGYPTLLAVDGSEVTVLARGHATADEVDHRLSVLSAR